MKLIYTCVKIDMQETLRELVLEYQTIKSV